MVRSLGVLYMIRAVCTLNIIMLNGIIYHCIYLDITFSNILKPVSRERERECFRLQAGRVAGQAQHHPHNIMKNHDDFLWSFLGMNLDRIEPWHSRPWGTTGTLCHSNNYCHKLKPTLISSLIPKLDMFLSNVNWILVAWFNFRVDDWWAEIIRLLMMLVQVRCPLFISGGGGLPWWFNRCPTVPGMTRHWLVTYYEP